MPLVAAEPASDTRNDTRNPVRADRRPTPPRRIRSATGRPGARPHLSGVSGPIPPDPSLRVLTQREVAELLKISERTLEEWRLARSGPPWRKVGARVRYEYGEVVGWFMGQDSHA